MLLLLPRCISIWWPSTFYGLDVTASFLYSLPRRIPMLFRGTVPVALVMTQLLLLYVVST